MLGESPDSGFITEVVDQIILPAVAVGQPTPASNTDHSATPATNSKDNP